MKTYPSRKKSEIQHDIDSTESKIDKVKSDIDVSIQNIKDEVYCQVPIDRNPANDLLIPYGDLGILEFLYKQHRSLYFQLDMYKMELSEL